MATFGISKTDGHRFIRGGFPLGRRASVYSTFQVTQAGRRVFDFLGYKGGEAVGRELFYALCVDGAVFLPHSGRPVTAAELPRDFSPMPAVGDPAAVFALEPFILQPRLSLNDTLDLVDYLRTARATTWSRRQVVEYAVAVYLSAKLSAEPRAHRLASAGR